MRYMDKFFNLSSCLCIILSDFSQKGLLRAWQMLSWFTKRSWHNCSILIKTDLKADKRHVDALVFQLMEIFNFQNEAAVTPALLNSCLPLITNHSQGQPVASRARPDTVASSLRCYPTCFSYWVQGLFIKTQKHQSAFLHRLQRRLTPQIVERIKFLWHCSESVSVCRSPTGLIKAERAVTGNFLIHSSLNSSALLMVEKETHLLIFVSQRRHFWIPHSFLLNW